MSSSPDGGDPPAVGDTLEVDLDWARRFALMRTHTALHSLCGVVWRDYGALVTGGNMEPGSGRMDFEFEPMSGDLVDSIEAAVNVELAAARDVRVAVLPRAEAFAIPDLIRTKINLLPEGSRRSGRSRSSGSTCRLTVARTSRTRARSGGSVFTGYESKGGSTSASGSRSRTRRRNPGGLTRALGTNTASGVRVTRQASHGAGRRGARCPERPTSRPPPTTRTRRMSDALLGPRGRGRSSAGPRRDRTT